MRPRRANLPWRRPGAALPCAAALCALLGWPAAADEGQRSRQRLSPKETAQLEAGELVTRPLRVKRQDLDLIGGSSWQVIDAPPEIVWRALHDTARYHKMLPGVKEARLVAEQGRERRIHVRQGAWPIFTSYDAIVRSDPATRTIDFALDKERPHDLKAAWGFARVLPYRGARTLLAFGMLADVGHGLSAALGRPFLQSWMLKVPATVKDFLDRGGRNHYADPAPTEDRPRPAAIR